MLDFHQFIVAQPNTHQLSSLLHTIANVTTTTNITWALLHHHLRHGSDHNLDLMCHQQTLLGLPKRLFPQPKQVCPICIKAKFKHFPKGTTMSTTHLAKGEYLHLDYAFWDIPSIRHLTSMLVIADAKTCMLWLFCTSSKRAPLHIITCFFNILSCEGCITKTIHVDENRSLARNAKFTTLLFKYNINMDTTGGYSTFFNLKFERPRQTISQLVQAMLLNSGHPPNLWCYCAENAADIYRYIYHSTLTTSPYEAWYAIKPTITDLNVWRCTVHVKVPSPKKSEDHVIRGFFMGFTKSRLLIRWLDPSSQHVKHAFAVKFDEYCTPTSTTDHIPPGSLLLHNTTSPLNLPEVKVNISDNPSFDTPIFQLYLVLPPQ